MHPIVSVITGELKCRGQYIDENGLDVHRHRVAKYPLERVEQPKLSGMCNAIRSTPMPISPSVECLHHSATETIAFDVVRILPSMGPMVESAEAVVLVVGEQLSRTTEPDEGNNDNDKHKATREDWYGSSDLNASILHLIKKLGNKEDCPWLTKTVFIVSPAKIITNDIMSGNATPSSTNAIETDPSLGSVVDAFMTSYLGGSSPKNSHTAKNNVRPLPPDFTFPIIRSVLVLNDVHGDGDAATTLSSTNGSQQRTEVSILPQGIGGALPNLDLVFATFLSFQSHPAGERYNPKQTVYYGDSDFRTHPFGRSIEDQVGQVLGRVGNILGLKESVVGQYARDLAGLFGFVAALVIGPRQPHASALNHGIDALTIEVRIPGDTTNPSSSIHPHYADLTRCVEHLLRSISNLHERLHHSIVQYTMPSPSKFVSHGEYIFPAILVSLPMVVRAATLALRDLKRFQFLRTGVVLGSVCMSTFAISVWAIGTNKRRKAEECTSEWISYVVFFISYLLVIFVARHDTLIPPKGAGTDNKQTKQSQSNKNECQGSLRFVSCLVGIYLHVPLLLANYSLGFPSSAFWSPLLASLVLPLSLQMVVSRNKLLMVLSTAAKCLFLLVTSPPILLVPRIFDWYTPYILGVYTPLHLLLATLWLA